MTNSYESNEVCDRRHSSKKFSFDRSRKVAMTGASDLEGKMFGRVFNDAIDQGFVMVSAQTGKEATFMIHERETDREGDVVQWILVPSPATRALTTGPELLLGVQQLRLVIKAIFLLELGMATDQMIDRLREAGTIAMLTSGWVMDQSVL